METTWFVVADQNHAQLFRVHGPRMRPSFEAVETIVHSQENRATNSTSNSHLSLTDPTGSIEEEQRRFVRKLVARLRKSHHRGDFRHLYLAAPANFVGHIRNLYGNALATSIRREIIGDYAHERQIRLEKRMRRWLD